MNTIVLKVKEDKTDRFQMGSIWKDGENNLYILAQTEAKTFAAIGLKDGNRYDDPVDNPIQAVDKLEFVAVGAKITVETT